MDSQGQPGRSHASANPARLLSEGETGDHESKRPPSHQVQHRRTPQEADDAALATLQKKEEERSEAETPVALSSCTIQAQPPPVNSSFVEYSIDYIRDSLDTDNIDSLLTNDAIWECFMTEANFSREEAEEVREGLMAQEILRDMEDEDIDQQEVEYREKFLKEFPQVKKELEEHIAQLRGLADKADKLHRDCTISNLVASSTSIVSGILTITGMALAPVTAGVSLGLAATGIGLGAASAVTGVTTAIVEHASMAAIEGDASKLTSTGVNTEEAVKGLVRDCAPKLVPLGKNMVKSVEGIDRHIRALKLISVNPRLAARATRLMNSGSISARKARQVQKAFGGTALAMSKGARIAGMATAGVFILMDVHSIVKQSLHLQEGAKAESASRIREQAAELEKTLQSLKEIYAIIQEEGL